MKKANIDKIAKTNSKRITLLRNGWKLFTQNSLADDAGKVINFMNKANQRKNTPQNHVAKPD